MSFEIGERVILRSLQWKVADTSSEAVIELYGRSLQNRGRTTMVCLAVGQVPSNVAALEAGISGRLHAILIHRRPSTQEYEDACPHPTRAWPTR